MSRCFPFPPPGYTLSRDRNEALIESIKLQKEKERKKEKQREKKQKRHERKERRKEKKHKTNQNSNKSDIAKDQTGQKICTDTKDEFLHKNTEAANEQLERSTLTEERGHPVSLRVPSSSSDSTDHSNKRKRDSPLVNGGKVLLIRLPSRTQNEFDAVTKEQQLCSTSGRTDFPAQNKDDTGLRDRPEKICSTSRQIGSVAPGKTGTKSMPNAVLTPMRRLELQREKLLQNWVPPRLQDTCLQPDDLDWLFQSNNQDIRHEKRQRCGSDSMSCSRSSALWPRAEFLHEVDVYALPFTVPY